MEPNRTISTGTGLVVLIVALVLVVVRPALAQRNVTLTEDEARALGTEAYVYGYPLVTMELTRRVMTDVASPDGSHAPMGQFNNLRAYPDATFHDVAAPNTDTLHSIAWLDLSREPYVLSLPDTRGRYYLMPILSAWTNVVAAPGARTTGTAAQRYVLVGPSWPGTVPAGLTPIRAPTNLVWILGRTYCTGAPTDYQAVRALQDQYSLVPLSAYGKPYTPPRGVVDPTIDLTTPVREQVDRMDAAAYFALLAKLLATNPPASTDAPMVAKLAQIGIVPGHAFELGNLDPPVARGLGDARRAGLATIAARERSAGKMVNGWEIQMKAGAYGTDYLQRAVVAAIGLGAYLPQDAIYPVTRLDSDDKPLNGTNKYVLHFAKGQTPPVDGFWSLALYDSAYYLVANPLNRHSLSPRNGPVNNPDHSIDLYIQNESPGWDKESNWLPAPKGDFVLMLRLYWPQPTVLDGTWIPPSVDCVTCAMPYGSSEKSGSASAGADLRDVPRPVAEVDQPHILWHF